MDENAIIKAQPRAQTDSAANPNDGESVLIPDHTLLRCIGHGSYGAVWLARNMMGVYRAVKIVYRKSFEDDRPFQRELSGIRKFEPISRSHEGFVDVLQVGINEAQGYFYYVMELGDDQTAGQKIDPESYSPKTLAKELSPEGRLSFQECLQLGLALSQALAELHKHELVHRDVKPSNIIFVNGIPKLADIGLVAPVSEARSYVGTEGFIPPEGPGAPQADVFGLGKVLYEASTGKDRQEFPELPTQFEKFPDHGAFLELNEVIVHACRNEVSERYATAWDLHADLLILANGKSVKRLKMLERRLSRLKRFAGIVALAALALAAISYQVYREFRASIESHQRQVGANIAYGNRAMEAGDLLGALPYFAEALRLDQGDLNQEMPHRLRLGSILAQSPKLTHIWEARTNLSHGEFSPDGNKILVTEYYGHARIYDLQTNEEYTPSPRKAAGLRGAVFSPDGRFLLTANEDWTARLFDALTLSELWVLSHSNKVLSARFSPDGTRIITSGKDGLARVWNVQTRRMELALAHKDAVLFSNFSSDGRLIVTTSYDNFARIWATNGEPLGKPLLHGSWVTHAAFSPDNQRVITACLDHKARVWKVPTGERILPDLNHRDGVQSAEFSPDNRLIVTASLDGTARLWLAETLQPLGSNPTLRHTDRVTHASFSPEGRRIITVCVDGTARVWDLAGAPVPRVFPRHSLSQDGSRLLTLTNNSLQICDTSGRSVSPVVHPRSSVEKAQLNRNGRFALTVSLPPDAPSATQRLLQIWDAGTGAELGPGILISNSTCRFRMSDDGSRLVVFDGATAQVFDAHTGLASPILRHKQTIDSATFSPDHRRLATRNGNAIEIWDAVRGTQFFSLPFSAPVQYMEFSSDGSRLVGCCSDNQLAKCYAQVWNATKGEPIGPKLMHQDGVLFAAFNSDNTRVVTAGEDFRAIVWDVATGKSVIPSLEHQEKVLTAAFSHDGQRIVTVCYDQTTRVWNAHTGDPLTPTLHHIAPLAIAMFLGDDSQIATADGDGSPSIWKLPFDHKPVEDLILLARLLSGNSVVPAGQLSPPESESLLPIWHHLKTKYPSTFVISADEIAAWHEYQAEDSEIQHQWSAAAFHLERLLAMRNGDQPLANRLAAVKGHLSAR